jgi:hypothetical protein
VPAAFVLLQELPLNRNGKIDRKALPAPDLHGQLQHQYVAPRTLVEEILCTTWGEVLRVERVGIHDNFFDLGGHSLAMVRVREKVQLKLDKSFPLIAMFEHSTIASLTEYLTDNNSETHSFEQINLRAREQRQRRQHQKDQRTFRLSSQQRL